MRKSFFLGAIIFLLASCENKEEKIFKRISSKESGIDFRNDLTFNRQFNIYTYRNYYNGGGVGIGDFNNDGLVDIYLTANQLKNRLYINKGDFKFDDISESAGVGGERAWSTGVSIADINGDGWQDIYVCNSGDIKGDNKQNELYINNGDLTFSERAEEYGLADSGYSTHAVFFDYDKDGDLDSYLLNNSYQAVGSFNLRQNIRPVRDPVGGDKLFRNDNGKFVDVSEEAGIYGSVIGFGLGVTAGDVNLDGWTDLFISNDFFERDYLYINNGDGTFSETLQNSMQSISAASMGADMADFNNDGYPDIFVTDMLPEDQSRIKQVTTFESWDKFNYKVQNNYHKQFSRNMLHLNNGDGTFSEVGRFAGVEATDWSWGALMFDMDNDGYKDIFVANGIYQDITDLDYLTYIADIETKKSIISEKGVNYKALVEPIPINPVSNYAFRNVGGMSFEDATEKWALNEPIHSNGSAYADLDNDGDMDLIINNVNSEIALYRNDASIGNYLKIILKGEGQNKDGFGAKVQLEVGEEVLIQEQIPIRGFQSTIDNRLNIGIGQADTIDQVVVTWPSGKTSTFKGLLANQTLIVKESEANDTIENSIKIASNKYFEEIDLVEFKHEENEFVDFDRDRLIYHMISQEGPALATGDVNGDGLDDFYIGGAKGQSGSLFIQTASGDFTKSEDPFKDDLRSEDTDAAFLDIDNDNDLDLFVASGGNEFSLGARELRDRLYINDGNGSFQKSNENIFSDLKNSTSTVLPRDYDNDGDIDLFLGSRLKPFQYGIPADGILLENDGTGQFKDITSGQAPALKSLGMITDAVWTDVDGDKDLDLVVVGEWMKIEIFLNDSGKLSRKSETEDLYGWWNTVASSDIDQDGDMDLIVGNHGTNSRFRAGDDSPIHLHINDFDKNGTIEHIFSKASGDGKIYPYTLKHELVAQMPELKKKYLKFENYRDQSLDQIFTVDQIDSSVKLKVNCLESIYLINDGKGNFTKESLPDLAQLSPIYSIEKFDIDYDNYPDFIIGGNLLAVKPEVGQYDANYGLILKNRAGTLEALSHTKTGFRAIGEIRNMSIIKHQDQDVLIVAKNNDTLQSFRLGSQ